MNKNLAALAHHPPDPAIHIRPVLAADVAALRTLGWPDRSPVAVDQLVARIQQYARDGRGLGVVVAGPEGLLLAYGQLILWPRCGEISDLVVRETWRGQGIGTAIVQYLVRAAREMHAPYVEIGAALSNPRALSLYKRLGFTESHRIMLNLGHGREPVQYLRLPLHSSDRA